MTDKTPRDENAIPTEQFPDAASGGQTGSTGACVAPAEAARPISAEPEYAGAPAASAANGEPRRRIPKRVLLIVGASAAALLVLGLTFAGGVAVGSIGRDDGRQNAADAGPGDGRGPDGGPGQQNGDRRGPGGDRGVSGSDGE